MSKKTKKLKPNFQGLITLMSDLVRIETLEEKEYTVCPVILITEGVHNNVLYTREEMKMFPAAWNGSPLPVYHPEENGKPITANSPDIIAAQSVGTLFNVIYEEDTDTGIARLKGEAWIDAEKADAIDARVMEKLNANEPFEVSTGLFTENEIKSGTWNSETYAAIAHNFRPDHLALLPDGIGACSWDDGAGLPRINEELSADKKLKVFSALGRSLKAMFGTNEMSHSDIREALREMVKESAVITKNDYMYVMDVYASYFIYEIERNSPVNTNKIYKQNYIIDAKSNVLLQEEAFEVERVVSYTPVTVVLPQVNPPTNKGTSKGDPMDRKEKVEALISNEKCDWAEEQREFLIGLEDDQFALIEKTAINEEEEPKTPAASKKEDEEEDEDLETNKEEETAAKYIEKAPKSIQGMLRNGLDTYDAQHKKLVETLDNNERCTFTRGVLEAKDVEELKALARLSVTVDEDPDVDFSALSSEDLTANSNSGGADPMPKIKW